MTHTMEEVRDKAAEMELASISFLASDGTLARKRKAVARTEFVFIDGTRMVLPRRETDRPGFDAVTFRLRPSRNDA